MTKKNRIISALVALAVLATSLFCGVSIFAAADVWDGSVSASLEGSGTAAEPYLIRNAADFAYFANQSRGGNNYSGQYVQLNDNISLNDVAIKPLGGFNGTFDGKGHEISGINITSSSDNQGFFTSISAGTIKNLTLTGSITSTGSIVGGFAGYVVSATFIKCINNLNVTGFSSVGGFCGNVNNGSANFTSCTNNGNITATNTANYSNLGGFAGRVLAAATANISLSENTGYIYSQKRNVVGGFIGQNLGVLYVENCINSGKVEGLSMVGGIVADVNNSAALLKIKNTINVGTIKTIRGVGEVASLGAILGYYTFSANSEVFENVFYRNSDYDYNGAADQQPTATPRGIAMDTPSDWTDGTIVTLLNNNEEPAFMQGENYPVFVLENCDHTEIAEGWLFDDNNHWHLCNTCGRKVDKTPHIPGNWVVDTLATPDMDGTTHRECTVCGKTIATGSFA
ncbi:MAG: hypothetical protein J6T73_01220, partial [Clostridia bacterium]|nr:hypothetical protein [Clostridia bacterium]